MIYLNQFLNQNSMYILSFYFCTSDCALIQVLNPFLQSDFEAKRKKGNYEPDERGDENAAERSELKIIKI